MLKIRRPLGRLIFNMGIAIPGKTVFLIETAPSIQCKNTGLCVWPEKKTKLVELMLECINLMSNSTLYIQTVSHQHILGDRQTQEILDTFMCDMNLLWQSLAMLFPQTLDNTVYGLRYLIPLLVNRPDDCPHAKLQHKVIAGETQMPAWTDWLL